MPPPILGTAHLFSIVPSDQVDTLLETAWDAGFRRFDTAPSYGFGETEAVLGRFLRHRSDVPVEITSKVGIAPSARPGRATRAAKSVARRLPARLQDRLRGDAPPGGGVFDVTGVRESVERSLAQLHHIDRLLLHEVTPPDVTEELIAALTRYVDRGYVGRLGVATAPDLTAASIARAPAALVTANVSVAPGTSVPAVPTVDVVGHGPLGAGGTALAAVTAHRAEHAEAWTAALAATPWRDPAEALVAYAATRTEPAGLAGLAGLIVTSSRPTRLSRLFEVTLTAQPLPPELTQLIEAACC